MVIFGVLITALGLSGLGYCIMRAWQAKRNGMQDDALNKQLSGLFLINHASILTAALGLAIITVGVLLGF